MKIVQAGYEIVGPKDFAWKAAAYRAVEFAGRTCYKSQSDGTYESAACFIGRMIERGHEAMLEHASMTVRFIVDRGVSHELVRHRLASYAQESTRFCNYSHDKFGTEITVIEPLFFKRGTESYDIWMQSCLQAERAYFDLLTVGESPERARSVLPNSLKTEVVMTANMRQWRHFLKLRAAGTTGAPHPQMAQVTVPLLRELAGYMPSLFGDILEARNADK